jgi:hypothetical protein
VPFLLDLPGMRRAYQAEAGRLLRVLQLRQRAVPAEAMRRLRIGYRAT